MGKSFRPGVGNIADFTEGKLKKKIIQYASETSADNVGDPGADGVFFQKSGTELQFKSLATGSNIAIADDGEGTLTISAQLQHDDVGWYQKGSNNIESSGSVAITGSLATKSTLSASGNSNLAGNVSVEGNFLLSGSATLGNAAADVTTITGRLTGSQGATFSQIVRGTALSGSAAISGQTLNVGAGRVTINVTGDLFGASAISGSGIGTFVGGVVTEGTLKVSGSTTLGDAAADVTTVTGRLTGSQGAKFSQIVQGTDLSGSGAITGATLTAGSGRVTINAAGALAGATTISGSGVGTFTGGIVTEGALKASGSITATAISGSGIGTFTGGIVTEGTLKASGSVTLGDAAADVTTVTGRLTASQGAYLNGRVGIGHSTPEEELDIVGDARVIKNSNSAGARPKYTLAKSRGSLGSESAVQSGDTIGEVQFDGYDGNSYEEFASIYAKADAAVGDGDPPGAIYFATTADGAASATQRMVIDSAGDIQISGSMFVPDDEKIFFGTGNETFIQYREAVDDFLTISGSAGGIVLSGSTVQIAGTLEGASPLKIAGGIQIVESSNGDSTSMKFGDNIKTSWGDSDDVHVQFRDGSREFMEISGSAKGIVMSASCVSVDGYLGVGLGLENNAITHGITLPNAGDNSGKIKATAYVTYSDERIKKNIKPIERAMDKVKSMHGVTYELKAGGTQEIGLIAQEIEKIAPEVVDAASDLLGIDYSRIPPILIEAVKDQQKQIDDLKKQLEDLKK